MANNNRSGRFHNNGKNNHRDNRDSQVINSFTLGTKELEGKNAEFQYDKGWYSIVDIIGEEKSVIYKSKNAQEAYTKWNVYIAENLILDRKKGKACRIRRCTASSVPRSLKT